MPLNQTLYALLRQEFGNVQLAHDGEAMRKSYMHDYSAHPPRLTMVPEEHGWGESYRVNCPYCSDTRGRLWINYLWGVWDSEVQSYNLWLAKCFNDNCIGEEGHAKELYKRVYGFKNLDQRVAPLEILPGEMPDEGLQVVEYPGECIPLLDLSPQHPANAYLRGRGYNAMEFAKLYNLQYCQRAHDKYRAAQGRLIIPITMNGVLVGWQGRYLGECDWKKVAFPKYYNLPGMKGRLMLYNYDTAKTLPFVVVTEGTMSAWVVGKHAVALLGKTASRTHIEMMVKTWKTVVLLLDGDPVGQAASLAIANELGRYLTCIRIVLPPERDPGNSDPEYLWALIAANALSAGVDLLSLSKVTADDNSNTVSANTDATVLGQDQRCDAGPTVEARQQLSDVAAQCPGYTAARTKLSQTGRSAR